MELNDFVANFADLFDDTDPKLITAETRFRDLDEWSSLTGMGCIAMAKLEYGKSISGVDLRTCITVEDVYNLIKNK